MTENRPMRNRYYLPLFETRNGPGRRIIRPVHAFFPAKVDVLQDFYGDGPKRAR